MEKTKSYKFELIGRAVVGFILLFILLGLPSVTYSATIALQWDPPTVNSDGSPLVDLARYRLYYGYESQKYIFFIETNKPIANVTVSNSSNYYFAATAINSNNVESDFSNEFFWNQAAPALALTILPSANAVTVPEGGTAIFQVKLNTAPVSPTTVTVSRVSGDTDITVQSGGSLVFNAIHLEHQSDSDAGGGGRRGPGQRFGGHPVQRSGTDQQGRNGDGTGQHAGAGDPDEHERGHGARRRYGDFPG